MKKKETQPSHNKQEQPEIVPIEGSVVLNADGMEIIKVADSQVITFSVKNSCIHPYKTFPSEAENQLTDYDEFYKETLQKLKAEFEKFPNCCEGHRKLSLEKGFDRENFKEVFRLATDKVVYSYNHILYFIKEENWEEEIKDYLDYTIESFGHFPSGLGGPLLLTPYFNYMEHLFMLMEKEEEYCFPARIMIIRKYLQQKITPAKVEEASGSDLNLLLKTYNKWYEIFPFELSYLQPLKEKFSQSLPIFKSFHTNKYSGRTALIPLTRTDLITYLLKTTNQILTEINTLYLYRNNLITNYSQLKLELFIKEREFQLQKGYIPKPEDESEEYYQIVTQWLKDEVNFITNLTSLFTEEVQNKAQYHSFDQEVKELNKQENLFWKGIPMGVVIEHFIKLTTHNNKAGLPYLTQSQFMYFIKRAFLNQGAIPKQTMNIGSSENGSVIKLFYQFFDLAVRAYGEKNKNEKYIRLVLDNFTNWSTFPQVKSLFRKDKSAKVW